MENDGLYKKLESFFPLNLDLMRHLHVSACWEYFVTDNSTKEDEPKLHYYLYKRDGDSLVMTKDYPSIKPDLILYFTKQAILNLIEGNPDADEYYRRYREIMYNPQPGIELDNQVNKPRLQLWRLGYKNWQKDFKF
jgi:hypothetical protein